MKFIVREKFVEDKIFDWPEDVCEYVENLDFYNFYDDMLDEIWGTVQICNYEYSQAQALKAVDPIAYRCGYNDWINNEVYNDLSYQLDCMGDGDSIDFYGLEISFEEEEEELPRFSRDFPQKSP